METIPSQTLEQFLSLGLREIANLSITRLKLLIKRLKKSGTPASLDGIKIIKKIIERKKRESTIMNGRLYGQNTHGMGRQNFSLYD